MKKHKKSLEIILLLITTYDISMIAGHADVVHFVNRGTHPSNKSETDFHATRNVTGGECNPLLTIDLNSIGYTYISLFQHSNTTILNYFYFLDWKQCCRSVQVESTYVIDLMKASRAFNLTLRPFLGRYTHYKFQDGYFTRIYKKEDSDSDKINGKDKNKEKTTYLYFNSNEQHWAVRLLI